MKNSNFNFKQFDRWFLKPILLLLFGCLLIAFIWEVSNKWIGLPLFLVGSILILANLSHIELLFKVRNRIKQDQKKAATFLSQEVKTPSSVKKQKTVYRVMLVLMIILTYSISFSGRYLENYLDWKTFMLQVTVLSVVGAYLFSKIFYHTVRPVFDNEEKGNYVQLYSYAIPALMCFHTIVFCNQFLQPIKKTTIKALVNRIDEKGKSGDAYVFMKLRGREQRFEFYEAEVAKIKKGDIIEVEVIQGAMGYGYLKRIINP